MNRNDLAPIGISTYGRAEHLKRTVAALKANRLASKSDLFIFSDGPKPGDEEKVAAVRNFIRTIDGFKSVNIFERLGNDRIFNNRGGIEYLLEKYERVIFMEEDVVTAPGFLTYMNTALDQYASNQNIFSITGYCPPINIPKSHPHPIYLIKRFNGWGFGIWKDRYEKIKYLTMSDFYSLYKNKTLCKAFTDGGGWDMLPMLYMEALRRIDALDVKAMYAQFLSNQYTVYPVESLALNIGFDGTGVHCGKTDRYDIGLSDNHHFSIPKNLVNNQEIINEFSKFRGGTMRSKLELFIRIHGSRIKMLGTDISQFYRK